jgi:hypothetical protein
MRYGTEDRRQADGIDNDKKQNERVYEETRHG